jgi:hypothetical protein
MFRFNQGLAMTCAPAGLAARLSASGDKKRRTSVHQGNKCTTTARLRSLLTLPLAAMVAGCWAVPPAPLAGADPSDPSARTRSVEYRSTVAPYKSQRPVEPKPWQEQNQQVTPPAKQ